MPGEEDDEWGYDDLLETMKIEEEIVQLISTEEFIQEQEHDEFLSLIQTLFDEGTNEPFLVNKGGVLTRTMESFYQLVINDSLRSIALQIIHHSKMAGHPGDGSFITTFVRLTIGLRSHWNVTQQFDLELRVHKIGLICASTPPTWNDFQRRNR